MGVLILLWLLTPATIIFAQLTQPARYEKTQKSNDHDFTVISMGEKGIALIRDKNDTEHGKKLWEIILLDSTLTESWTYNLPVETRYNLIGHDYRDQNLYFLYRQGETDMGELRIVRIKTSSRLVDEFPYKPELSIRPTHFNAVGNQIMLGGYVSNQPTILLFNLENNQSKIVPGLLVNNSELLDVRANVNNTFNVLIAERQSKVSKKLISKTFDEAGVLLLDDIIEIDTDKTILAGLTSTLVRDELLIVGTWSEGISTQASGIFTVLVDPYSEQKINFYDFGQLSHFFDYLSPKRAARTKEKSDKKRQAGKVPDFKTHVLPCRLEETKNGFAFYNEAYYTSHAVNNTRWNNNPYNYSPYNSYNPYNPYRSYNPYSYGYPYSSYSPNQSTETKMQLASLSILDSKGILVADHGFKMGDLRVTSATQTADFILTANRNTLLFNKEKEINLQVTQEDGVTLISEKIPIQINNPTESIRSDNENIGSVRFWYDHYLYLYGYQTLKNPEKNRDVFYINKIKVE